MDATKEVELAKEYFVQGFPTLMLFRKGVKVGDYDGGRTSGEIVDYMRKQADPNWKPPPSVVLQLSQDNFYAQSLPVQGPQTIYISCQNATNPLLQGHFNATSPLAQQPRTI